MNYCISLIINRENQFPVENMDQEMKTSDDNYNFNPGENLMKTTVSPAAKVTTCLSLIPGNRVKDLHHCTLDTAACSETHTHTM